MSALAAILLASSTAHFGAPPLAGAAETPRRVAVARVAVRAVVLRAARAEPAAREGELHRSRHRRRDGTESIDFD